ncbi:hypothetical protein MBLNU459_g7359t1 [Dothideomycetes sp. NU459]
MLANDGLRDRARGDYGRYSGTHSSSINTDTHSASMPQSARYYPRDEESGKKNDDRRPGDPQPRSWPSSFRWRRKRIAMGLIGAFLLYLFVHNIPTDLGSIDERMGRPLRPGHSISGVDFGYRPGSAPGASAPKGHAGPKAPTGAPPRARDVESDEEDHYYNGPIKFYELASSLHQITGTMGHRSPNRNVLFAASSLKSAANLIPIACEMARFDRNYVHLVLLGRDALPMQEILEINGIADKDSCAVYFHDGRSDYSEYSSEARAQHSVIGAMTHVDVFMHPQVIITDDSAVEDIFFIRGMRQKAEELERPVIEIPKSKYDDFMWITRLDSSSLASWHKPSVDILVHAPPDSSGSLLRLLESIKQADYAGLAPPRLTIELPADIEHFARDYIRDMEWPPKSTDLMQRQNSIRLHHRVSTAPATSESGALRFLESFYPTNPDVSHVLLLSAQAELSPLYYQYIMFHILEHRHSSYQSSNDLFGLALSTPATYLNGSEPFVLPTVVDMTARKYTNQAKTMGNEQTVPFLWQAPNADAALIFGEKWSELHEYLKNRFRASHDTASVRQAPTKRAKVVAETQPGWMEYMLELMRARGWLTMFPAKREAGTWATVHQDLYQVPEEFEKGSSRSKKGGKSEDEAIAPAPETGEPFLRGDSPMPKPPHEDRHIIKHSQPLHLLLPFDGDLPELSDLPHVTTSGDIVIRDVLDHQMIPYVETLRKEVGGCDAGQATLQRSVEPGKADDLFCFEGQDVDEDGASPDEEIAESIMADTADSAEVAVEEPHLDSTAKQKMAYMKAGAAGIKVDTS